MRVLVLGVDHMKGKSKKTGADYDMCRLYVAQPVKGKTTADYTRRAAGYEQAEVDLEPAAYDAFAGLGFPQVLELVTDTIIRSGRMVPVVTGFVPSDKRATA